MGTDIHGAVEIFDQIIEEWFEFCDAALLMPRGYHVFGSLFGVRPATDHRPIAPFRGLPLDASASLRARAWPPGLEDDPQLQNMYHSHSWVAWTELKAVDWDEVATNRYITRYKPGKAKGEWVECSSYQPLEPHGKPTGAEWMEGTTLHRVRAVTRGELLLDEYRLLFDIMGRLAGHYGDEHVRLVVWFDS